MKTLGLALTLALTLAACEMGPLDPADENAARTRGELVPVYFVDGHGLTAVYKEAAGSDITTELFELVREGPGDRSDLRSFIPGEADLIAATETESDESLRLELSSAFWELPAGERFAAAAQIAFTYASLEEGKRILLLDGTVPGELRDGNGDPVRQPLTSRSFADLQPWVQVQQPVAGASVPHSFPVRALLVEGTDATVDVLQGDRTVINDLALEPTTVVELEPGLEGEILLRISVTGTDEAEHITEMLLRLTG